MCKFNLCLFLNITNSIFLYNRSAPDLVDDEGAPMISGTNKGSKRRGSIILNKEYPEDIVKQLGQFGFSRKQILIAMESVDDKNNINAILDVMNQTDEVKQDEPEHSLSESLIHENMTAGFNNDIRQFYMIDMEGMSHGLTHFTKKLFYACYTMSNVIIWNDKQIGSDAFKQYIIELAKDMKIVSKSERKPCLLYLQRDTDEDIDFGEYQTLDGYLKNHNSFQWLRDINIFSGIHGYQIEKRPKTDNIGFDKATLNKLIDFILNVTFLSDRFVENGYDMRQQIDSINEQNKINLGLELVFANEVLRGLIMDKGLRDDGNLRRGQIVQYAEKYKWDINQIESEFKKADDNLLKKLMEQGLIDNKFRNELIQNKQDVIDRIQEKKTNDIIKITLILTSPITIPLGILLGLASAIVIGPYLVGSAIYDVFTQEDDNNNDKK